MNSSSIETASRSDNFYRAFIDDSGSAILEFSLVLPLLVFMLAGIVDIGFAIQESMVISGAAHAGTAYGSITGNYADLQGMQNASNAAAQGVASFSSSASQWCACSPNGSVTSCSSSCSNGFPLVYVQVKTSATLPAVLNYPGLPGSFSLSGLSAVRVR